MCGCCTHTSTSCMQVPKIFPMFLFSDRPWQINLSTHMHASVLVFLLCSTNRKTIKTHKASSHLPVSMCVLHTAPWVVCSPRACGLWWWVAFTYIFPLMCSTLYILPAKNHPRAAHRTNAFSSHPLTLTFWVQQERKWESLVLIMALDSAHIYVVYVLLQHTRMG